MSLNAPERCSVVPRRLAKGNVQLWYRWSTRKEGQLLKSKQDRSIKINVIGWAAHRIGCVPRHWQVLRIRKRNQLKSQDRLGKSPSSERGKEYKQLASGELAEHDELQVNMNMSAQEVNLSQYVTVCHCVCVSTRSKCTLVVSLISYRGRQTDALAIIYSLSHFLGFFRNQASLLAELPVARKAGRPAHLLSYTSCRQAERSHSHDSSGTSPPAIIRVQTGRWNLWPPYKGRQADRSHCHAWCLLLASRARQCPSGRTEADRSHCHAVVPNTHAGRLHQCSSPQSCSSCCCSAHHMLSYACMRRGWRCACYCSAAAPTLVLHSQ